jgi:hypothetical protein
MGFDVANAVRMPERCRSYLFPPKRREITGSYEAVHFNADAAPLKRSEKNQAGKYTADIFIKCPCSMSQLHPRAYIAAIDARTQRRQKRKNERKAMRNKQQLGGAA